MAERNIKPVSIDERDNNQRSLGFVGLSALAHVGLLIAVALAPSFKTLTGEPTGTELGATLEMVGQPSTSGPDAAAGSGAEAPSTATEVLLADSSDSSAVAVAQQPVQEVAQTVAAAPIEEVVAQKQVVPAKPVAPVAPKVKSSKPAVASKLVQAAVPVVAAAAESPAELQGDVETNQPDPVKDEVQAVAKVEQPEAEAQIVAEATTETAPEEKTEVAATNEQEVAAEKPAPQAKVEPPTAATVAAAEPTAAPAAQAAPVAAPAQAVTTSPAAALIANQSASQNLNGGSGFAPGAAIGAGTAAQSNGGSPSGTSPVPSRGDSTNTAMAIPLGAPLRDARTLIALPGNPKPTYPLSDRVAGRQGTTVLVGRVQPDGTMAEVLIERSSGSKLMDDSAAKAFKGWRYKPGQQGFVRYPVQFQLVGDAKEIPTQLRRQ